MLFISKNHHWLLKLKKILNKDVHVREIVKGGSVALIINLIGLGFGYLFIILIARVYGNNTAGVYGKYVLVTLIIRIGSIITRFGTDTAMLQQTAGLATVNLWGNIKIINKKLLRINLSMGLFISLVLILLSGIWARLFKLDKQAVFLSGFFIIPMALGLFYSQSLRGLKKIGISSFLQNSSLPTLNFFLILLLLPFFHISNPLFNDIPVITFYISVLITLILGITFWKRSFPIIGNLPGKYFDPSKDKSYKQLFQISYPLLLAESMVFLILWVNQLMLGVLGTPEDVGIFNLCVKYAMLAALPLKAITTIGAPKFSEFYFKNDYKGLKNTVINTTRMIFWISVPVVILYIIFPEFFLNIFGSSFSRGSTALILLGLSALVNVMTGDNGALLQMTGKQVVLQNILLVILCINVLANLILIPLFGVTGAAITNFICSCISNFCMTWYIKKNYGFYPVYFPFLFNSKFKFSTRTKN